MNGPPEGKRKRGAAIASLVLGILGLPTAGLLLLGAMAGIVLGVVGLVKARNEPEVYGGKGLAVAGIALSILSIVVTPVLGIIAAIAIPGFLQSKKVSGIKSNEEAVIEDMRSVAAAQASYRAINGGHYDTLECLAKPSGCIPGYSGSGLLDAELAKAGPRTGYHRAFYPGPPPATLTGAVSPSSASGFAYVAIPVQPQETGFFSYCVDAGGEIRVQPDGTAPGIVAGSCPDDWDALR